MEVEDLNCFPQHLTMKLILDGRAKKVSHKGNLASLLKKLGVRREEVVVKVNGRLAPDTAEPEEKDTIEVIKVIFGG